MVTSRTSGVRACVVESRAGEEDKKRMDGLAQATGPYVRDVHLELRTTLLFGWQWLAGQSLGVLCNFDFPCFSIGRDAAHIHKSWSVSSC
jgi:hypothetical protein